MVNNWSLRLVLGVFSLTGYTRLGSAHTTGYTPSPYRPHPQPLPASPPTPTGLTPNPSPRGEGSDMLCLLHACYWLTCYLPASPTAPIGLKPATTSLTHNPSPRGEGSDMRCLLHACYLSTRQLPNHSSISQSPRLLVNLASRQLLPCPLFSNNFNTKSAIFIHQLLTLPQKFDSRGGLF